MTEEATGIFEVTGALAGETLCKIQRPLFDSSGEYCKVLLYNMDRSITGEFEVDPETLKELFPDGGFKSFVVGRVIKDKFHIRGRVTPDEWPEW